MACSIKIDQAGKPAGVAGKAREDLALAVDVSLTAVGGPYAQYAWTLVDRPPDIIAGVDSSAVLSAPTSAVTLVTPIDHEGTYYAELLVDSGSGLGAGVDDVARITFYAGTALAANPQKLPRRQPAFRERDEHNVNDLVFPAGNVRGWAQEWLRWFEFLKALAAASGTGFAGARVAFPAGGPTTIVGNDNNIATVTYVALGTCDVVFTIAAPDANYGVVWGARGTPGGSLTVDTETVNGFRVYRSGPGGALVDADFSFQVQVIL